MHAYRVMSHLGFRGPHMHVIVTQFLQSSTYRKPLHRADIRRQVA